MKKFLIASALTLSLCVPAITLASDREDDISRIHHSAEVFKDIMNTPDKGIPHDLLERAKCVAIIPGEKKFAFIVGGTFGRGVAMCRTAGGWGAPMFVAVDGGSVGYQIGGSSTDIVMLFMNDHALQSLMSDKFKLGADASVAAGPVGRDAAADTDAKLRAEILTYSRSRGVFAGVSLDGSVVQADKSGDSALYGPEASRHDILEGKVKGSESGRELSEELGTYSAQLR